MEKVKLSLHKFWKKLVTIIIAITLLLVGIPILFPPTPATGTAQTKIANAVALGGYLEKYHDTSWTSCKAADPTAYNGSSVVSPLCGDVHVHPTYFAYEAFLSFDTSIFNASTISSAILEMQISADASATDFNVDVYSGQNAWNTTQFAGWDTCSTSEGAWRSTSGIATNTLYNMTILNTSISLTGNTQFRLISSRYATNTPTGNEYVTMHGHAGDANLYITIESANSPTYSNNSTSTGYPFGGNSFSWYAKWNASTGNLSKYIFSWDNGNTSMTNETAVTFGVGLTEDWSNVTKSLNVTGDCTVHAKIYANNTSDAWNVTATFTIYVWKQKPSASDHLLGQDAYALSGFYFEHPSKNVVYVAYLNTSYSTWHYYVGAYDINTSVWVTPYDLGDSGYSDSHYIPTIGLLPDHRLIFSYSYYDPLKYRISTNNASVETNITKIISEWGTERNLEDYLEHFDYPRPLTFGTNMLLFGRSGTSFDSGNYGFFNWIDSNYAPLFYTNLLDNSYTSWSTTGTTPYLNGSGTIYAVSYDSAVEGNFWFPEPTIPAQPFDSMVKVTLCVNATTGTHTDNVVKIELNKGGNLVNYSLPKSMSKSIQTFDVTSQFTSLAFSNVKAKITMTADGHGDTNTIYFLYFNVTWRGFANYTMWASCPADKTCVYWLFNYDNSTNTVIAAGVGWNTTEIRFKDLYFAYSSDNGTSWKAANGTALTLPFNPASVKIATTSDTCHTITTVPYWDENGKVIIPVNNYTKGYDMLNNYVNLSYMKYSATLGSAGSWSTYSILDENGSQLQVAAGVGGGSPVTMALDTWYNRSSFWASPLGGNVSYFVLFPSETGRFLRTFVDQDYNQTALQGYTIYGFNNVYQLLSQEEITDALGNMTIGDKQYDFYSSGYDGTAYGTNYTAQRTMKATFGTFYGNIPATGSANYYYQIGVYHAGNLSLAFASNKVYMTRGSSCNSEWVERCSFSTTANFYAGANYFLCVRTNLPYEISGYFYYNNDSSSRINQTLTTGNLLGWYADFPSNLTNYVAGYLNISMNVEILPAFTHVRGFGTIEFSDIATNSTFAGTNCEFRATITDKIGLSHASFSSNNTGSWTTTYTAVSGMVVTVRFNITLNNTVCVIAWEIDANDTNNYWGNSTRFYMTTIEGTNLNVGWNSMSPFSTDVGKSLGEVNASLAVDSINWSVITIEYLNGTQWSLIYGTSYNAEYTIASTSNTLWIYCNVAKTWYHTYP